MIGRCVVVLALVGSLLSLAPQAEARCSGTGKNFRCDPIIPKSYSRYRSPVLPGPYTAPKSSFRGRLWDSPTGYSKYKYRYKSGGRTYKGTTEVFPGGTIRHKGKWK